MYNNRAMKNKAKSLNITEDMGINTPELQRWVYEIFNEKNYSIKNITTSHTSRSQRYRTINHWSQKGLINQHQDSSGKWHKFSYVDLLEILIYEELRKIGFPLTKLLKVRSWLSKEKNLHVEALGEKIPLTTLGHKALQTILGGHTLITVDQEVKAVAFTDLPNLIAQLRDPAESHDELYQGNNAVVIVDLRKILNGLGLACKEGSDKHSKLFAELYDTQADKEVVIRQDKTGKFGKIESTHFKDFEKEQNINKLVRTPNQETTFRSNSDGNLRIKIKKNIK